MIGKTQLATLDYNYESNNNQAITKDGKCRCKPIFSKVTENWVVNIISETKYPEYLNEI